MFIVFKTMQKFRILATTRNAELFAAATCSVDVIHVESISSEECKELFSMDKTSPAVDAVLCEAFSLCSGNIALLNILNKLSAGRLDRLNTFCRRLKTRGLSSLTATTAFGYESMHDALTASVERLPSCDRDTLACAVIFPSEQEIPLEIWALVVPVDVIDTDESELLMLLSDRLKVLCENGDWLSYNQRNETFRFSRMVESYLRETVEAGTVKTLISILKSRLDGHLQSDTGSPVIKQFFQTHSSLYKNVHGLSF
ncbi:hypothetical protein NECAME_00861 [Necator americanus]|uniref:CED4 winged-helix domain-containing protein n=1 Tax=Necator americanus TaxID=51031 RepID=W2SR46_NECAM|nr:hypothetical protein NECAME_00861 [Necator americanus]ETN71172.1 hypothetical protein NECAME_00861 [Necator americanus]